ncbi:uncharacterized protein BDR25DRAFT_354264 [Lindgomyces ingoldianus]|uniref:Uncharacterized protein n=1 Tax=Lindgomyces ingoldianus TaxID=673940 RepID=A0ACB6QZ09_9PLEO|nr:uncharacterized protein BDR25DRAFT_354264 [Lindgomyces ingoldianus]KAF2471775.1 hypothetical protein BDR25DRAFT_354264 [Lindgomyces ingoldianus]
MPKRSRQLGIKTQPFAMVDHVPILSAFLKRKCELRRYLADVVYTTEINIPTKMVNKQSYRERLPPGDHIFVEVIMSKLVGNRRLWVEITENGAAGHIVLGKSIAGVSSLNAICTSGPSFAISFWIFQPCSASKSVAKASHLVRFQYDDLGDALGCFTPKYGHRGAFEIEVQWEEQGILVAEAGFTGMWESRNHRVDEGICSRVGTDFHDDAPLHTQEKDGRHVRPWPLRSGPLLQGIGSGVTGDPVHIKIHES